MISYLIIISTILAIAIKKLNWENDYLSHHHQHQRHHHTEYCNKKAYTWRWAGSPSQWREAGCCLLYTANASVDDDDAGDDDDGVGDDDNLVDAGVPLGEWTNGKQRTLHCRHRWPAPKMSLLWTSLTRINYSSQQHHCRHLFHCHWQGHWNDETCEPVARANHPFSTTWSLVSGYRLPCKPTLSNCPPVIEGGWLITIPIE